MKTILLLLLTACSCWGQAFTLRDPAFVGQKPAAASAFSPGDVAGIWGWWSADTTIYSDAGSTPCVGNTKVKQWNTKAGSGPSLINDTVLSPTFKTNIINTLPAVLFSAATGTFLSNSVAGTRSQPQTVFLVMQPSGTTTTYRWVIDGTNSTASLRLRFFLGTGGATMNLCAGAGLTDITDGEAPTNSFAVYSLYFSGGAGGYIRTNGVQAVSGAVGTSVITGITVGSNYGGSYNFDGYIAEIIWYTATLADADRNNIENYLKTKYGL